MEITNQDKKNRTVSLNKVLYGHVFLQNTSDHVITLRNWTWIGKWVELEVRNDQTIVEPFLNIVAKRNSCSMFLQPNEIFSFSFQLHEPGIKECHYPLVPGSLMVTVSLNPYLYGGDYYLLAKDDVRIL